MPVERVSHVKDRGSKYSNIHGPERFRSSGPNEGLRSPVNRKAHHPPQIAKSHRGSRARDDFLSCATSEIPHSPKKHISSVPRDVLTSSVERQSRPPSQIAKRIQSPASKDAHKSSAKSKTAYSSPSAQRPLARLSKKRVYNESQEKPLYYAYSQCVCDLEEDSNGEAKLPRAKRSGKALYVLDHDGTRVISCAHLRECDRFVVKYPMEYDPATIASDFLRAVGSHPRKPALNQYWNQELETELQAISNLKGG